MAGFESIAFDERHCLSIFFVVCIRAAIAWSFFFFFSEGFSIGVKRWMDGYPDMRWLQESSFATRSFLWRCTRTQ